MDRTRKTLDETMAYLESGASLPSVDELAAKGLVKVIIEIDEREKDVAIARAMGIQVVDWPYEDDLECGGLDPIMEDDDGKPNFGLSLGPDSEFAKEAKEEAIYEPSYRHFYVHNIPDDIDLYTHSPIPDYSSREGCWEILDYVRDHPTTPFTLAFDNYLRESLEIDEYMGGETVSWWLLTHITPAMIKEAAWRASQ